MAYDIGFLGGGQLARMSIQAAQKMGLSCLSLDPGAETPASQIAPAIQGTLNDPQAIAHLASECGQLALENEFIPADSLAEGLALAGFEVERMLPGVGTLATIQDKLRQRSAFREAGVPSPRAVALENGASAAIAEIGFPMVLKARFGGYDGKGTRYARTPEELQSHTDLWSPGGWLAEAFVPFRRELAVMVFVDGAGQAGCFPTMETLQTKHVCDLVLPSGVDAGSVAAAAVRAVSGRGLFGVELFELEDGSVQINEIAPRPHNTGHYTMDWGGVSQFEQHVRLVMGLPCVPPVGNGTCMANLLGQEGAGDFRSGLKAALEAEPEARVHWYGKSDSRAGRKMGHINVAGDRCVERAMKAREAFYRAWTRA